jgi:hypothetical protein
MVDRAIVVGIQGYPELPPPLHGPENDAREFFDWLTTTGGLNPDPLAGQAKLILSSDPDFQPPSATAVDARPTTEAILREFDRLEEIAKQSPDGRAGRRLYLYLSGHGFGQDLNNASLLMANATQSRTRYHIPGRAWADHFYLRGLFDEVVLFMDCCRERYATAVLNGPGSALTQVPPQNGRRFYGFSAKHGRLSVELMIDGRKRGVFTATLLDALGGGAAEENGDITGESLQAYLYQNMREYLTPAELADADIATEPDLFCDPPPASQFVIARVPPKVYAVQIPLPPGSPGDRLELRSDNKFALVAQGIAGGSEVWELEVPRGTYLLVASGTTKVVTVKGRGKLYV